MSLVLDVARTGGNYHPMQGIANVIGESGHGGTTQAGDSLDLFTALKLWAHAAAAQNGEGQLKGIIAPSMYGDFAVPSADPRSKSGSDVYTIETMATICAGIVTYMA